MTTEQIAARIAELEAANAAATGWGAAVGARAEEIDDLRRELRRRERQDEIKGLRAAIRVKGGTEHAPTRLTDESHRYWANWDRERIARLAGEATVRRLTSELEAERAGRERAEAELEDFLTSAVEGHPVVRDLRATVSRLGREAAEREKRIGELERVILGAIPGAGSEFFTGMKLDLSACESRLTEQRADAHRRTVEAIREKRSSSARVAALEEALRAVASCINLAGYTDAREEAALELARRALLAKDNPDG